MGFGDFFSGGGGSIISSAIGAVGSLIGGHTSSNAAAQMAAQQYANQKEFAQNGVRWKVADAKAAGIHPLAALGAQTFSYNPVMTQYDNGVASALQQMGQGVERAVAAKQLAEERALDRRLKEAQIANVEAQTNAVNSQAAASRAAVAKSALPPPMPNGVEPQADRNGLYVDKSIIRDAFLLDEHGRKIAIVPSDDMKSRTEDVLGVEWFPFISSGWRDFKGRVLGKEVDGHWWHGDFDGGQYLPYPRSEIRGKISRKPPKTRNFITVEFPLMR